VAPPASAGRRDGPQARPRRTEGFNLVGHLTTRMGLGAAARMTLGLIEQRGWPVSVVDVGFPGLARVPLVSDAPVADIRRLPNAVTLMHMNPEQIVDGMLLWDKGLVGVLSESYLATVPYWELPVFPTYWIQLFQAVDCVLAPSRFVESALLNSMPDQGPYPSVLHFMQAVQPPGTVRRDRSRWFGNRA